MFVKKKCPRIHDKYFGIRERAIEPRDWQPRARAHSRGSLSRPPLSLPPTNYGAEVEVEVEPKYHVRGLAPFSLTAKQGVLEGICGGFGGGIYLVVLAGSPTSDTHRGPSGSRGFWRGTATAATARYSVIILHPLRPFSFPEPCEGW